MRGEINFALKRSLNQLRTEFVAQNDPNNMVDYKTFNSFVNNKVEKGELMSLLQLKSNVQDTEINMKATDILHKQLKHVLVLLIEVFRKDLLKFEQNKKPKNSGKRDAQIILNQAVYIAKWINSFNPENINTADLKLPKELGDFQNFVNITMENIQNDESNSSSLRIRSRLRGSITEVTNNSRISFRNQNRSASPKHTKYNHSSCSKRSEHMRWSKFLGTKRKFNQNELSNTFHEQTSTIQDQSESNYIFINEPNERSKSINAQRANTSSMTRTAKLNNPLFNF